MANSALTILISGMAVAQSAAAPEFEAASVRPALAETTNGHRTLDVGKRAAHVNSELGPSIFTAIQQQLGLRLDAQKVPVDFLVIDRAEKATEN